jgi:hypothetical protein
VRLQKALAIYVEALLSPRFYDHEGYDEDALEAAMERFETIVKREVLGWPRKLHSPSVRSS